VSDAPASGVDEPVDWEPEQPRRGPIGYLRDNPSALFAWLGAILFVGGWGAVIYVVLNMNSNSSGSLIDFRLQFLVSTGSGVTLVAGVLWGVSAYLWVNLHVLPHAPQDAAHPQG
jgi:hypothetical protein